MAPRPEQACQISSRVLQQVPGCFAWLGACPPGSDPENAPMNHSPLAMFDDVLADGSALMAQVAARRLERI